jgi:hypothetical protein
MTMRTDHDERVLVTLSLAADRRRLAGIAARVLDRGDAVTDLLRAACANDDEACRKIRDVCDRRGGNGLNVLDLAVEIGQQDLLRSRGCLE